MMDPMCKPCEKDGVLRKALRIVPKVGPLCHDHYQEHLRTSLAAPANGPRTNLLRPWETPPPREQSPEATPAAPAKQEEKQMPLARTDVDWAQVQKDYDAGLGAQNIAKKYGVHVSSVYLHVKKSARPTPAQRATEAPKKRAERIAPARTGGGYDQVIADLRMKRDKLNAAIEALEGM